MGCNKCYRNKCNGNCSTSVTRQIKINNNSQSFITGIAKLEFESIEDMRNMSQETIEAIKSGNITSVSLLGYYEKGDTPAPIEYYLSDTTSSDDGGSVIEVGDIKLEHDFEGVINPLYYGAQTGLTQSILDKTPSDTTYEITSILDLNGSSINTPLNTILNFRGGELTNGSISTLRDYFVDGNYKKGLSRLSNVNYGYILSDSDLIIDVTNMPGTLAKYNLINDNTFDNSDNFINIFNDSWFIRMVRNRPVTLLFSSTNRQGSRPKYLFKKPCHITAQINLKIVLYADIRFDLSSYSFRTIQDVENGVVRQELSPFKFTNFSSVKILGAGERLGDDKSNRAIIDCGLDTIQGNFLEGVTINDIDYYSVDRQDAIYLLFCKNIVIDSIAIRNSMNGIQLAGEYISVNNVEAYDIHSDNGITVGNNQNETLLRYNRFAVISNCYVHDCADVGISVQCLNAVVINCIAENCGNDNISLGEQFGIGNSFNSGGGYSTELLDAKFITDRRTVNVSFINCQVKNCYNYGFFTDSGGVSYNSCKIENITPTYIQDVPDTFKYVANKFRGGFAFVFSATNFVSGELRSILKAQSCIIKNVPFIFKNSNIDVNRLIITDSEFININGNSDYNIDDLKNTMIINSSFDSSYNVDVNIKYKECFRNNYVPLIPKRFSTLNRPLLGLFFNGEYGGFDETLGKPIYKKNDTTWVDATGATV